jgi:DNA-binding NarL/FixJ family response regulator
LKRANSRILIVDDYLPWRRFLRSTLEKRADLQIVGEASDGQEAVTQTEALKPELVLLDIGLPVITGIEAARQICVRVPQTKILFLTQDSSTDVVEEALHFGLGYVMKLNASELLTAIDEVLDGRQFVSSAVGKFLSWNWSSHKTERERFVAEDEGIFRVDMDSPLPVNLSEREQIEYILRGTFVADCNDTLARMYGLNCAAELIGKRMSEMVVPDDPKNIALTREFIRSGYRVLQKESYEVDIWGNAKVFLNSMTGVIVDGKLIRTWGRQSDITESVRRVLSTMTGDQNLSQ